MADIENRVKTFLSEDEMNEMKKQALDFLASHYFYAALDVYQQILESDPDDKDAHIGVLLCENKFEYKEDLLSYYKNLYSIEEKEIRLACDKDDEHIEEMCERFYLEKYFEKNEIRRIYDFDVSFKSSLFCRKKQKDEILKLIDKNEHLSWLRKNNAEEFDEIIACYDKRIDEALKQDKEKEEQIKNEYQRFLYKTYSLVKEKNREAVEQKDRDYLSLIEEYESSEDIEELRRLVFRFESFEDYKKAGDYVDLCKKKIDELKSRKEEEDFKRVIQNTLDQARADLLRKKYNEAYEGFTKVIALDGENEQAHLGALMALAKVNDEKELFDYYKNLYSEETRVVLKACDEDKEHIDDMVDRYCLASYLDEQTIRKKYEFDLSYSSVLSTRIQEKERFKNEFELNPLFVWLKKNGSLDLKNEIKDVYAVYENRVREARQEDQKNIERIKNDYQRFLFKTYASIKSLYQKANDKKEDEYRRLIKDFDLAYSENELRRVISSFEQLEDYKQAKQYIEKAYEKIDALKQKKESEDIVEEIETTLIAARAYLASGNIELADASFSKVLSLDENNPRAYLGILMIETACKNEDELVDYLSSLYKDEESQTKKACEANEDHIEEMAEKYFLAGYLPKETIRKYYHFDLK